MQEQEQRFPDVFSEVIALIGLVNRLEDQIAQAIEDEASPQSMQRLRGLARWVGQWGLQD